MKKRIHIFYDGRVQGVGFRFTVEYIASDLNVKGWVKNLHDGRVEAMAEAEGDALNEFLKRIRDRMGIYIVNEVVDWFDAKNEFKSFDVTF